MKKILLVLMVVALLISITACTGYETQTGTSREDVSTEELTENVSEEEIKEKIIGVWDMNGNSDMFAVFADDGLLVLYQKSKQRAAVYNYEVEDDTITATGESSGIEGKVMTMSSIKFEDGEVSFTQNGDSTHEWYECDSETAREIIDIIINQNN